MSHQTLTLRLDGITAADYLQWCRDPEPAALDFGLRSMSIAADPLGDTITAVLDWDRPAPTARAAATAAGLPLTADVRTCESGTRLPPPDRSRPASTTPRSTGPVERRARRRAQRGSRRNRAGARRRSQR